MKTLLRMQKVTMPVSLLLVTCVLITSRVATAALSFSCVDGVKFDSTLPLLKDPKLSNSALISKKEVCGVPTQFDTSCQSHLIQQGEEYNYSWRCNEAFGDLYFTAQDGGYGEFRCIGEKVNEKYSHRVYRNCKLE